MKDRLTSLAAAALLLAGLAWPLTVSGEPYRLNAQDRLLIRVLTWDLNQRIPVGWRDLSGEYSLSSEGILQLPLAGEIAAKGLTQAEFVTVISDLLRRRAGLNETPMLSVELVSSLPVYVLGHVESRGAVQFRPGLSAHQALALAGGTYRGTSDPVRIASASAELRAAEDNLERLLTDRESLDAELATLTRDGARASDTPADDQTPGEGATALSRLQQADRAARMVRVQSYDQLRDVLKEKGERLSLQLELRNQQVARARKELDDITLLNERGLAVNARVTSLLTVLNDHDTRRLELETALLLLEEQRNQANRDSNTLIADAMVDRLQRREELEKLIAQAELDRESARLQTVLLGGGDAEDAAPRFILTRDGITTDVDADTTLLPGDTLEIAFQDNASPSPEDAP